MFLTTWQLIFTNCFLDMSLCKWHKLVNVVPHTLLRHVIKKSSWNVIIVGFVVMKLYFLIQKKPKRVLLMILLACIQSKLTRSPTEMCENAIISRSLGCPWRYSPWLLCCTAIGAIHYIQYLLQCLYLSHHNETMPRCTAETQRNVLTAPLRWLPIVLGLDQPVAGSVSHDILFKVEKEQPTLLWSQSGGV